MKPTSGLEHEQEAPDTPIVAVPPARHSKVGPSVSVRPVPEIAPEQGVPTTSDTLVDTFRGVFLSGRFLLTGLVAVFDVWYFVSRAQAGAGLPVLSALVLTLLLGYQVTALILVRRSPIARLPSGLLLAADLVSLYLLLRFAGPALAGGALLTLFALVISAAALLYGVRGGVLTAIGAMVAVSLLAPGRPAGLPGLRQYGPYFLLTGGFTGFLVERLQSAFARRQSAALIEQRRTIDTEVFAREMDLARQMQQAALPLSTPEVPGLEIAAISLPAREVGGDFYLFLESHEGSPAHLGLVVGDVSGKGIAAALAATSVAHLLPWLRPLGDPAAALEVLNRDARERLPGEAYVTLILADIDREAGSVRLWSAGHTPVVGWRARESRTVESSVYNSYLGLLPAWGGSPESWPLDIGDVLVLYSDGLSETRDAQGKQFGSESIARVLGENALLPAPAIAQALIAAEARWGSTGDDLTLVVCKRVA